MVKDKLNLKEIIEHYNRFNPKSNIDVDSNMIIPPNAQTNNVFIFPDEGLVLRVSGRDNAPLCYIVENWAFRYLKQKGINVPEIKYIYINKDYIHSDIADLIDKNPQLVVGSDEFIPNYMVETLLPGRTLKLKDLDSPLGFSLGESFRLIHDNGIKRFSGFGLINEAAQGDKESWLDYLSCKLNKSYSIMALLKNDLAKRDCQGLLDILESERIQTFDTPSFLVSDPKLANIIVYNDNFYFIDIDHPILGDPLWDIAIMLWSYGEENVQKVFEGYNLADDEESLVRNVYYPLISYFKLVYGLSHNLDDVDSRFRTFLNSTQKHLRKILC